MNYETIKFGYITDIHAGIDNYTGKQNWRDLPSYPQRLDEFIDTCNNEGDLDFVIIGGDITDSKVGSRNGDETGNQIGFLTDAVVKLSDINDIPIYYQLGNHEDGNFTAAYGYSFRDFWNIVDNNLASLDSS